MSWNLKVKYCWKSVYKKMFTWLFMIKTLSFFYLLIIWNMYEEHHLQKALLAREKKKKATRLRLQFEVMLAGKAEPTSSLLQSDLEGSMYLPFWHSKKQIPTGEISVDSWRSFILRSLEIPMTIILWSTNFLCSGKKRILNKYFSYICT